MLLPLSPPQISTRQGQWWIQIWQVFFSETKNVKVAVTNLITVAMGFFLDVIR